MEDTRRNCLVVFSHLRWQFVYQRPQHLMSRLARQYEIFFFEEPVHDDGEAYVEVLPVEQFPRIHVCRPHTSVRSAGFHDEQLPALHKLLATIVARFDVREPVVWFYTPMALPLLQGLGARLVVYDCMDELSAFRFAPRQLLQRENALLKVADLVFTGGASLYRAKQNRHPNVHCFPSSVDRLHFSQASDAAISCPAQNHLPRPRLGYMGVIDERVDLALIDDAARQRPGWQFVLVGPVAKIEPASLPSRSNIHWFGQQSYADLPRFVAGWDVCLMPFALNEATRFISPTKTLEYMAAEKPIVSTAVHDVATQYSDAVRIATSTGFVSACDDLLQEAPEDRERRVSRMTQHVARTSWDQTASSMQRLIEQVRKPALRVEGMQIAHPARELSRAEAIDHQTVIIGAGPTGLSAAYHLEGPGLLLDRQDSIGGVCRSIQDRGFTFDCAGHIMFSHDPYVHSLYKLLLGDNVHWQEREAWIYSNGVHTRYPFQGALYGLPPEVISECLMGAIEARTCEARAAGSPDQPASSPLDDCCADGVASATVSRPLRKTEQPANFEDFIYRVWGRGVARHFAIPYNRKLWTIPLEEMETSWLGDRVPLPDLAQMIEGALRPPVKPMGPNARFGYPLRGGFQALMDGFRDRLRTQVRLGAEVTRVHPAAHIVELRDGTRYRYQHLINTMPLPEFVAAAGDAAPAAVKAAAKGLRHASVRCVNLGVGRENLTDKHWIYYPGPTVFHRIFMQGNASSHCNPPGGFGLTCEITYGPRKPLPSDGDELIDRCIADCISVGIIRPDDPIVARNEVDIPYAYVIYDHDRARHVATIRQWARAYDITFAGRYAEWEYYNSDHAFLAGRRAAVAASDAMRPLSSSSPVALT